MWGWQHRHLRQPRGDLIVDDELDHPDDGSVHDDHYDDHYDDDCDDDCVHHDYLVACVEQLVVRSRGQ
jgi:hypothetical protein